MLSALRRHAWVPTLVAPAMVLVACKDTLHAGADTRPAGGERGLVRHLDAGAERDLPGRRARPLHGRGARRQALSHVASAGGSGDRLHVRPRARARSPRLAPVRLRRRHPVRLRQRAARHLGPTGQRHEDHVGHKVEWENDIELNFESDAADALFDVRCDVLTKLHQGTHSKDAFTNNLHELVYHIRCTDGTEMHVTVMAAIGIPGQFERTCDRHGGRRSGPRCRPTRRRAAACGSFRTATACRSASWCRRAQRSDFDALHENWETSISIRTTNGHGLAFFNPYFQVLLPSRFYDPAAPNVTGRPIDVCYEVTPSVSGRRGGPCDRSTSNGTVLGMLFDDPRSEFNGVGASWTSTTTRSTTRTGPTVWYQRPVRPPRPARHRSPARSASSWRGWTIPVTAWGTADPSWAAAATTAAPRCTRRTDGRRRARPARAA